MATALKLKNDIKKLKAAINSKATPKSFVPKLKAQLEKAENELESLNKGGKPRKTSTTKGTQTTLSALQKMVNKKKYKIYKNSGVDLKKDAVEGALATGRRISKGLKSNQWGSAEDNKGNVYYEYRPNRLDVKQPKKAQKYPKLEKGGYMAKGGMVDYSKDGYVKAIRGFDGKIIKEVKVGDDVYKYNSVYKTYNSTKNNELLHKSKYASGGYMAKGGIYSSDSLYILKVSKDGKEVGEERFRAKNIKEAMEMGEDYEDKYKSKFGSDLSFSVKEATSKMASGGYMADGVEVDKELIDSSAKSIYDKKGMMALRNTFLQAAKADEDAGDKETAEYRRKVVSEYQSKQPKYMAKGGEPDMLKEDDYVWNAAGKKLIVDKVTDDEYYLYGFMQVSPKPWSKTKIHNYIKNGEWSLKPKMADGGEHHRSEEKYADGGKIFSEKELKMILDEKVLYHVYMAQNGFDMVEAYLRSRGQGGVSSALYNKLSIGKLYEVAEKIEEYTK